MLSILLRLTDPDYPFWSLCSLCFLDLRILITPFGHLYFLDLRILITPFGIFKLYLLPLVDVTAGGQFALEDIIRPVTIECMTIQRLARTLVRTSSSIQRSGQDDTREKVSSETTGVPLSQDTTNNSNIRNSDRHTI